MKIKTLFVIITSIFITSCSSPQGDGKTKSRSYGDFTIKDIDSCEYIEYDQGFGDQHVYSLTHKGNCKFCVKRNKIK